MLLPDRKLKAGLIAKGSASQGLGASCRQEFSFLSSLQVGQVAAHPRACLHSRVAEQLGVFSNFFPFLDAVVLLVLLTSLHLSTGQSWNT